MESCAQADLDHSIIEAAYDDLMLNPAVTHAGQHETAFVKAFLIKFLIIYDRATQMSGTSVMKSTTALESRGCTINRKIAIGPGRDCFLLCFAFGVVDLLMIVYLDALVCFQL